jgi:prolyl-tRNA synthetase
MDVNGKKLYPNMGSYGIGVSRVVAAAIEASHDERGIIWPKAMAPFDEILINVKVGDPACDKMCEEIYANAKKRGVDMLYDDTKASLGQKLAVADLIGIPTQLIVGPKTVAEGKVEIKDRRTGNAQLQLGSTIL